MTAHPHVPSVPGTETLSSFVRRRLRTSACSLHSIPDQQPSISTPEQQEQAKNDVHGRIDQRLRWVEALHTSPLHTKLATRLQSCGTGAWVERCSLTGKTRVVAPACKLRFCPRCAGIHARRTRARLETWAGSVERNQTDRLRLITLTQRSSAAPLDHQLRHLYAAYRRLRQRALWKKATHGAIAVLQVTFNASTQQWHPHLHVVHHGKFIDYRALRAAWSAVTHGSDIVDIREIHNSQQAADYVTRYVSRPLDDDPTIPPPRLCEFVTAIKGRRLLIASGKAPLTLPDIEDDGHEWQYVDSLAGLYARAEQGDLDAIQILRSLPGGPADAPDDELTLFDLAEPDDPDPHAPGT